MKVKFLSRPWRSEKGRHFLVHSQLVDYCSVINWFYKIQRGSEYWIFQERMHSDNRQALVRYLDHGLDVNSRHFVWYSDHHSNNGQNARYSKDNLPSHDLNSLAFNDWTHACYSKWVVILCTLLKFVQSMKQ